MSHLWLVLSCPSYLITVINPTYSDACDHDNCFCDVQWEFATLFDRLLNSEKNKRKITLIMKFAAGLLALASADVKIIGGFTPTPNSEPYILSLQKVSPRFLLLFLEHFLEWFSFLWSNHRIRHPLCLRCSLLFANWCRHCCCRCSRHLKKWIESAKAERYFVDQPRELQLEHRSKWYCRSLSQPILFEFQGCSPTTSR